MVALSQLAEPTAALEVTATAKHPKLGTKSIPPFVVYRDMPIPETMVKFEKGAAINSLKTDPDDPIPESGYTIQADTICAPPGAALTLRISGSDTYADETTATLSETVTGGTLFVPGAKQGTYDTITAELVGSTTDFQTLEVVF